MADIERTVRLRFVLDTSQLREGLRRLSEDIKTGPLGREIDALATAFKRTRGEARQAQSEIRDTQHTFTGFLGRVEEWATRWTKTNKQIVAEIMALSFGGWMLSWVFGRVVYSAMDALGVFDAMNYIFISLTWDVVEPLADMLWALADIIDRIPKPLKMVIGGFFLAVFVFGIVAQVIGTVKQGLMALAVIIGNYVLPVLKSLLSGEALAGLARMIPALASQLLVFLVVFGIVGAALQKAKGDWKKALGSILLTVVDFAELLLRILLALPQAIFDVAKNIAAAVLKGVKGAFLAVIGFLRGAISTLIDRLPFLEPFLGGIRGGLRSAEWGLRRMRTEDLIGAFSPVGVVEFGASFFRRQIRRFTGATTGIGVQDIAKFYAAVGQAITGQVVQNVNINVDKLYSTEDTVETLDRIKNQIKTWGEELEVY